MKRLEVLGLNEKKVENIVNELSVLLADLQVFYSNLRGFHWNVKGHGFFVMHNQSLRIKGNRGKRKECNYLEYHHLAFSYYFEGKQERASNVRSSVTKS